jgi:DNA-binding transcriptional ArsR family regulator
MPNQLAHLDTVFHALASPTRRAVVGSLSRGPAAVTELAEPFDMALPSFMQHLKVLEDCGMVRSTKSGRVRTVEMVPGALQEAENWMVEQRMRWTRRLDQLDTHLKTMKKDTPAS